MRQEELDRLANLLINVDEATKLLPIEQQHEYEDAQQSVIDARRAGERLAHTLWIL